MYKKFLLFDVFRYKILKKNTYDVSEKLNQGIFYSHNQWGDYEQMWKE